MPAGSVPSGRSPVASSIASSMPTGIEASRLITSDTGLITGTSCAGTGSPGLMSRR
jgi:hypothetical protein